MGGFYFFFGPSSVIYFPLPPTILHPHCPLSSTHIPRRRKAQKRSSLAPHPQASLLPSLLLLRAFLMNSAHYSVWPFTACNPLVYPPQPCGGGVSPAPFFRGGGQGSEGLTCWRWVETRPPSSISHFIMALFSSLLFRSLNFLSSLSLPSSLLPFLSGISSQPLLCPPKRSPPDLPEVGAEGASRPPCPITWFTGEVTEATLFGWVPRPLPYPHRGTGAAVGGQER